MAGAVLSGLSILVSTAGQFMGLQYQKEQAKYNKRVGELRARQTDTAYTEELNRTVSTIKAIRASGNVPPDSPSTAAVISAEERKSNINRLGAIGAEKITAEQYGNQASMYGTLAGLTLLGGVGQAAGYAFT